MTAATALAPGRQHIIPVREKSESKRFLFVLPLDKQVHDNKVSWENCVGNLFFFFFWSRASFTHTARVLLTFHLAGCVMRQATLVLRSSVIVIKKMSMPAFNSLESEFIFQPTSVGVLVLHMVLQPLCCLQTHFNGKAWKSQFRSHWFCSCCHKIEQELPQSLSALVFLKVCHVFEVLCKAHRCQRDQELCGLK